jgi:hypothetical protein
MVSRAPMSDKLLKTAVRDRRYVGQTFQPDNPPFVVSLERLTYGGRLFPT